MYIDRLERRYVLGCTCLRPERFLEANRCPKGQGKSQGRRGCTAQYIPTQGSVQPLSQKAQNGPNYSKRPKMTQKVPKWPKITQMAPNLPEMSQNCINFAKLPKWLTMILKAYIGPKLAQRLPKWSHRSKMAQEGVPNISAGKIKKKTFLVTSCTEQRAMFWAEKVHATSRSLAGRPGNSPAAGAFDHL